MADKPEDYLAMSDEDFLKLPEIATGVVTEAQPDAPVVEPQPDPVTPTPEEQAATDAAAKAEEERLAAEAAEAEKNKQVDPAEPVPEKKDGEVVTDPNNDGKEPEPTPEPPNYEALVKQILAPIKANGKTIEIKTPEEAIRLMQQGAGFARKMQDIQPHLKTLRFLEQNQLLGVSHEELAYLVDLRNKNPDAIKKLVKEAGIDPLDFNNEEPVNYRTNIAPVSDQQVAFVETLNSLKTMEGGAETINAVSTTWDEKSHQQLMETPDLLEVIHEQRQNGIYDRITAEVDRQRVLGNIKADVPFLHAYKLVGDHLRDTNGFADLIEKQRQSATAPTPTPQLLETRAAQPKTIVPNNAQVKAAAPPKTTPRKAAAVINPLALSDEEFTKQFGDRY